MADVKKQAAENMKEMDKFQTMKRASTAIPALIVMNEYLQENHSYEIIMIISTQKQMIIIIVISHK